MAVTENEVLQEKKRYNCKRCQIAFETRAELASHIYQIHTKPLHKPPKKHLIPREFVKEFDYIGNTGYVRLSCEGALTEKGMEVERFIFNR